MSFRALTVMSLVIMVACSSSTSRLVGSLSEPVDIVVAIPSIETDAVPLLYGFVSDSFKNAVYPINLSLRKFVESDVPYFPLMIPVGRYPTRMSVDRSQRRLFVLNYLDKDISVVDTLLLTERGFGRYLNAKIEYTDDGIFERKKIGLYATDLKAVYNQILKKEFLIVTGLDDNLSGRLKIIDIEEKTAEGLYNKDYGSVLYDIELGFLPGAVSVSSDGDIVYIGAKDSNRVAEMRLSYQGIVYIDTAITPDVVRLNGFNLFLVDTVKNMFSVYDTKNRKFISALPESIFGIMKNQPFQGEHIRDIAFSPETDLGGRINTVYEGKRCVGTVGYAISESGGIFPLDISGCTTCEEADKGVTKVPCFTKGWYNLPVEDELVNPTVSRPLLQIGEKILSYNEQGMAEYPYIDGWSNSERNFGIGVSRLFRSNMFNRNIQITYEGEIVQTTGVIRDGRLIPDIEGFEDLNISSADLAGLMDINGIPLKNCDDGSVVEKNEFRILSVSSEGISVEGTLPKDDCIKRYIFVTRPSGGWTVTVDGYGFLGRAYENQRFLLKDDKGYSHIDFTLRSGKSPSERKMKFYSTILLFSYGFSPAERLIGPSSIKVVRDSIDADRFWGLVVFTGSSAIWQFSSRDLSSAASLLYR